MHSESASLSEGYVRCVDLYRTLTLGILGKESSLIATHGRINHDRILDESGRLRIWGDQTKASLPTKARGSLDHFLRNEENLRREVHEVLNQLQYQLVFAIQIVEETGCGDSPANDDLSNSLISDSDYSSDSESGEDGGRNGGHRRVPKLSVILAHIFEQIQLLYHFGSLLRRPGLKGRYLRHDASEEQSPIDIFDLRHVEEKLRQWDREADGEEGITPEEEDAVTEGDISRRAKAESNTLSSILAKRFAKANVKRRDQLRYWSIHPYRPIDIQSEVMEGDKLQLGKPKAQHETAILADDAASTIKAGSQNPKSDRSRPTVRTFSTVAQSAIFESGAEMEKPRTIYAESVVAGKRTARVPPPPRSKTGSSGKEVIECPYCHMELDAKLMENRTVWKRHIFRDLRPYSCTFSGCTNPNKLYTTRHDWAYHEMQMHRRCWICQHCSESFDNKDQMVTHLISSHPDSWLQHQLPIVLEMNERPIDESVITPCSLCKSELSLKRLVDHLAGHMEEISLFVLPTATEGDDDAASGAVMAGGSHADRISDSNSNPSLIFSDRAVSDREEPTGDYSPSFVPVDTRQDPGQQIGNPANNDDPVLNPTAIAPPLSDEDPFLEPFARVKAQLDETLNHKSNPVGDAIDPTAHRAVDLIIGKLHDAGPYNSITTLTKAEHLYLLVEARDIMMSQPILLELKAPIVICGDIRGELNDLRNFFMEVGFPPEKKYLFLGNYVTHNALSYDSLCLLLAYKIKYPEHVFLLRGSGDDVGRLGAIPSPWDRGDIDALHSCFSSLPWVAVVDEKIFAVHGGLSPKLHSLEQIRKISRPTDDITSNDLLKDLLWSSPDRDITGWREGDDRLSFGRDIVKGFLQKHDMDVICRSRQRVSGGFEFFAKRKLVTIFSAPSYPDESGIGSGAVMTVDEDLVCSFKKLQPSDRPPAPVV